MGREYERVPPQEAVRRLKAFLNVGQNAVVYALQELEAERRQRVEAFTPGPGLTLTSKKPADQRKFLTMLRREMLRSRSFSALVFSINANTTNPVTMDLGRNQRGVFVDSFDADRVGPGHQRVDMNDLEKVPVEPPAAFPDAVTQGEILAHSLAEANAGATTDFRGAHEAGVHAQNAYRDDRGQKGHLSPDMFELNASGNLDFMYDNKYIETWVIRDSNLVRIDRIK